MSNSFPRTLDLGPIEQALASCQDAAAHAPGGPVFPPGCGRLAAGYAAAEEAIMKHVIRMALAAVLLAGCAQLTSDAPYSAREACEGSGGAYSSDGTCSAGLE